MIDLAQLDRTLRTTQKIVYAYVVIDNQGNIYNFDNHSDAIRFTLQDIDNRKVVRQ